MRSGGQSYARRPRQHGGLVRGKFPKLTRYWLKNSAINPAPAPADRVNMAVAILPLSESLRLSSAQQGLVQSSFFWWAGGRPGGWDLGRIVLAGLAWLAKPALLPCGRLCFGAEDEGTARL